MFAWEERTSIDWARESVRGIASRLIAVTPRSARVCMRPGSMSGERRPTSAWPLRRRPTSCRGWLLDLDHDVGQGVQLVAGHDRRPGLDVRRVVVRRAGAGLRARRGPRARPPSACRERPARARRGARRAWSPSGRRPSCGLRGIRGWESGRSLAPGSADVVGALPRAALDPVWPVRAATSPRAMAGGRQPVPGRGGSAGDSVDGRRRGRRGSDPPARRQSGR